MQEELIQAKWPEASERLNHYRALFEDQLIQLVDKNGNPIEIVCSGEIVVLGEATEDRQLRIYQFWRIAIWSINDSDLLDKLLGSRITFGGPVTQNFFDPTVEGGDAFVLHAHYRRLSTDLKQIFFDDDAIYSQIEQFKGEVLWAPVEDDRGLTIRLEIRGFEFVEGGLGLGLIRQMDIQPIENLKFTRLRPIDDNIDNPIQVADTDKKGLEQVAQLSMMDLSLSDCSGSPSSSLPGSFHPSVELHIRFVNVTNWPETHLIGDRTIRALVNEQLYGACRVWLSKGGVKPAPKGGSSSPHIDNIIDLGDYVSSIHDHLPGAIIGSLNATDLPNNDAVYVRIFIVRQLSYDLPSGVTVTNGIAIYVGGDDVRIILSIESCAHNKYLLAHELIHVLGLRHIDANPTPYYFGIASPCSVGVPITPMSKRNTEQNLNQVIGTPPYINPYVPMQVLGSKLTTPATSKWKVDTNAPNSRQYIRDFPYDDGSEPSELPDAPYTSRNTHSDVWNYEHPLENDDQYFDFEPVFLEANVPNHSEPRYGLANYMYVRSHTCGVLEIVNNTITIPDPSDPSENIEVDVNEEGPGSDLEETTNVRLFLGIPGASTGPDLIELPVSTGPLARPYPIQLTPHVNVPAFDYVEWTLAAPETEGSPSHCCVFAIATSATEPEGLFNTPPSSLSDLGGQTKSNNNVAQRNLNFQNISMLLSSASLTTYLPWNQFSAPMERDIDGSPSILIELRPDATRCIEHLQLYYKRYKDENNKGDVFEKIDIDQESTRIEITENMLENSHFIFRLKAGIKTEMAVGDECAIDIGFYLGDSEINGYRHIVRVRPQAQATEQILDRMLGTFNHVAQAFGNPEARDVSAQVDEIVRTEFHGDREVKGCLYWLHRLTFFWKQSIPWQRKFRNLSTPILSISENINAPEPQKMTNDYIQQKVDLVKVTLKELAAVVGTFPDEQSDEFDLSERIDALENIRRLNDLVQESSFRVIREKVLDAD